MINPLEEQKVKEIKRSISYFKERSTLFPDKDTHLEWIGKIYEFIESKGGSLYFGIERYKGDLEFFTTNSKEEYALAFMTNLTPLDIFFVGTDWEISLSSYPEYEYSSNLEYSIRLYGEARIINKNNP